jgi:hypothetical protein
MSLWRRTLGPRAGSDEYACEVLRQALDSFRQRVGQLIEALGAELPMLTVHDLSHLDALWRVADEIAGPDYPLNAAEAFVLGGAILLHDAAHVLAAYPEGLESIRQETLWQDFVARDHGGEEPPGGSAEEKVLVFQVLRHLHARRAGELPSLRWKIPRSDDPVYLLEETRLRAHYGPLIGEIASSHHWATQKVAAQFGNRMLGPPSFLPAAWVVDSLKVALLLRTADAAHLDDGRAPWFLFALRQPTGISLEHWKFQARMSQPVRTADGRLRLTAGSPFMPEDRRAWWLAFDTARMIDRELRDAQGILRDWGRPGFAAGAVINVASPEDFARDVPVRGWEPIDIAPTIGNVPSLISTLGGSALYGKEPTPALRELLQNALDAVRALRSLKVIGDNEGFVEVALTQEGEDWWLSVLDSGIGMSRHVLTHTLLDFGSSLWRGAALYEELPGLARSGFEAVGKFGIGFYSVFMLGEDVRVVSRRFERSASDSSDQWQLRFDQGLQGRPLLSRPVGADCLVRSGTRVSVRMSQETLQGLLGVDGEGFSSQEVQELQLELEEDAGIPETMEERIAAGLQSVVAALCPASPVEIRTLLNGRFLVTAVRPGDWLDLEEERLRDRVGGEVVPLIVIADDEGVPFGRAGLLGNAVTVSGAALVYKGVHCGSMAGLSGVLEARDNNADAPRTQAHPKGSLASWARWADQVLAATAEPSKELLMRLQYVLPHRDLPIWELGGRLLSLAGLSQELQNGTEVLVVPTDIEHEQHDEVGQNQFKSGLQVGANLLVLPHLWQWSQNMFVQHFQTNSFPWVLGVGRIDYRAVFETQLTAIWGVFTTSEPLDSLVVGSVEGVEIARRVTRYIRG